MQAALSDEDSARAGKRLRYLDAELSEEGAAPDKGIVLGDLEKIAAVAEKSEKYAEPIGKIAKVLRKFLGFSGLGVLEFR